FQRTLKLIDAGKLPVTYLQGFVLWNQFPGLTLDNFAEALKRLLKAIEEGDNQALKVALDMVGYHMQGRNKHDPDNILSSNDIRALVWQIMEALAENPRNQDHYWWGQVLESLLNYDPARVTNIAVRVLIERDSYEIMAQLLVEIAGKYPEVL